MRVIHINAQLWERYYRKLAVMQLASQKGSKPVSVNTFEHEGFLFVGWGATFPGVQNKEPQRLSAYRLIPESMYEGETTTVYHDEQAISAGTRKRGCLDGLVVIALKQRLVCAEQVEFHTHNNPVAAPADELEQMSLF